MGPVTWILVGLLTATVTGVGGYAKGKADGRKAESAETAGGGVLVAQAIEGNTELMTNVMTEQLAPLVTAAETQALLADDRLSGCSELASSLTPVCIWDRCLRTGQSTAARAEGCNELLDDVRIQSWVTLCGETATGDPNWDCVDKALKAAREQD
jgi:hypothetical protein